jgi:hypothetical protein
MTANKGIGHNHQKTSGNLRPGILNGWIVPVIISGLLLLLAVFLVDRIVKVTFTQYANCDYLIVKHLKMDPFLCNGYDVKVFDATIFSIPDMKSVVDPPLERIRSAAAWGAILLFAFISLFLTIIIVNVHAVIGLLTFKKEGWKKFIAGARVWLFLFVGICTIFYFAVVK